MSMLANYQDERAAFRRLLEQPCKRRIVMYRGASGCGKTSLIEACRALLPPGFCHVPMDLRGSAMNVGEILSRAVVKMGGLPNLPNFSRRLASLSQVPSLNLADNTLEGTQNQINVVVRNAALPERQERYVQLTGAWFEDLAKRDQPLLLMLDTFEQANEEVRDWVGSSLLGRVEDTPALRVLLSGQTVPEKRIDWSHCCQVFDLYGVKEAEHWLPVVEALGHRVPVEPPLTFMAGICHAHNGHPDSIVKTIKTFPRK